MPYIPQARRTQLNLHLDALLELTLEAGDLNYCFSYLAKNMNAKSYLEHLIVHGTFGAAGAEYYRRQVAPYEERKMELNGDV